MLHFDDLITAKSPPPGRIGQHTGEYEKYFTEPAVMLAYAFHLLETYPHLHEIRLHPDGEHGKQFDIQGWLEKRGFQLKEPTGKTSYAGRYINGVKSIQVILRPGLGDVIAKSDGLSIIAECKGGIINTRHPGQKSRLRKGICEAIGQLMTKELQDEMHVVVAPYTTDSETLVKRMRARCGKAGISLVLIQEDGVVITTSV